MTIRVESLTPARGLGICVSRCRSTGNTPESQRCEGVNHMAIRNRRASRVVGSMVAMAAAGALVLSGCAGGSEPEPAEGGATGEPIVIGGLGEETGSVAAYPGIPRLLEEGFKEINAAGG